MTGGIVWALVLALIGGGATVAACSQDQVRAGWARARARSRARRELDRDGWNRP